MESNNSKIYLFPLPNKNALLYQLFAYGIIIINICAQFFMVENRLAFIAVMAAILTGIIMLDVYRFKKTNNFQPIGIIMLALGAKWFMSGVYWAFFLDLLLWFLYILSRRKLVITISKNGILYPSIPKKLFRWNALTNVMLKDDILTIDCKNNKIYQPFIADSAQFANEAEFNDFCKKQLAL